MDFNGPRNLSTHCVKPGVKRHRAGGFTLVEVLTAVAIAMILLLGVNVVFRMVGQTVKAGTALAGIARDARSAQSEMFRDFHYSLAQPPCFIIGSHAINNVYASQKDRTANFAQRARTDRVSFFSSGDLFHRQTGDPNTYISPTVSSEAFITYGILSQINASNGQEYPGPPPGANASGYGDPNDPISNYYSQNWILGRNALTLVDSKNLGSSGVADQNYYPRPPANAAIQNSLALRYNAPAFTPFLSTDPLDGGSPQLWSSRYDMAAVTIDQFRKDLFATHTGAQDASDPVNNADGTPNWWMWMFWQSDANGDRPALFFCKPTVRKQLTSRDVALTTPYFIGHVSNFIVDFAGDYLKQDDASGNILGAGPDGKVDYIVDTIGGHKVQRIRWYGLRRNSHNLPNAPADSNEANNDIRPLHELLLTGPGKVGVPEIPGSMKSPQIAFNSLFPFDKPTRGGDWRSTTFIDANNYTCMWLSDAPAMIRVTFKIEDPTNGLQDGRWYELVLRR